MLFCRGSGGRGGLATCGVSESGGRGLGFAGPGAGFTSIGGGSGATCPETDAGGDGAGGALTTGGAGGRGAAALCFAGGRRGSRPGVGTGVALGGVTSKGACPSSGGSDIGAGIGGGGSPRSMASSLRVS